MPDTAPPRPDAEPQPAPAPRAAEATPPVRDTASRKPPEEDALFRALVDAGAGAVLAYTADKRIHTMISEAVAPQLQPFLIEIHQRFDAQQRRFDEQDRKLDILTDAVAKLTRTVAGHGEKLAEHDRKLDVISARLDGLKAHVQILFGAMALLITVLIAVFGYLFTA